MKINKYQGGAGIIPLIFTPLQTPQAEAVTKTASADKKSLLDDDMIASLATKALPSDLQYFVNKSNIFGNSLSGSGSNFGNTEKDIKSLLLYTNKMAHEKDVFTKAMDRISNIKGNSEIAISPNNGIYVKRDGKLKEINLSDLKEDESPLTNSQLAQIREHVPGAAFDSTMTRTLSNATSMKEIDEVITTTLTGLGETRQDLSIFQDMDDISTEDLQSMRYNELIKEKTKSRSNANQINSAISAIYRKLTPAQQVLLTYKADQHGIADVPSLLLQLVISRLDNDDSFGLDLSKRSNKGSGTATKDPMNDIPFNEAMQLMLGIGFNEPLNIHEGTHAQITAMGTHSTITSKSGESIGQKAGTYLLNSSLEGSLDTSNMSIGGAKIDSSGLNHIMIKDSNVVGVDLPITTSTDGTYSIVPDYGLIKKVQEVEKQRVENNITDITEINQLYVNAGLPVKYLGMHNGTPILNTTNYGRFIGVNVMADRKAFDENLDIDFNNRLDRVSSEARLKDFQNVMRATSNDDNYKYTDSWIPFTKPEVWNAVLWIPLKTNTVQAFIGAEENINVGEAMMLDRQEQEKRIIKDANERYTPIDQSSFGL